MHFLSTFCLPLCVTALILFISSNTLCVRAHLGSRRDWLAVEGRGGEVLKSDRVSRCVGEARHYKYGSG